MGVDSIQPLTLNIYQSIIYYEVIHVDYTIEAESVW